MPRISAPQDFNVGNLFLDLESIIGRPVHLKCEGFNFAGSIKIKAARQMVEAAERAGRLGPGSVLIESSSGNLGVALSMICASRGHDFLCVTDERSSAPNRRLMRALGARVHVITEADAGRDGMLGARIAFVRDKVESSDRYVWLNQYGNRDNWMAHYLTTGPEIMAEFPDLDTIFVGAGTTGTLMGCARYIREWFDSVHIVAIDPVGSVTFGAPAATRKIPGLGTGVRPPILDESFVDEVLYVDEVDAIRMCHRMARHGFVFGGSTGTVVSGALRWLDEHGSDTRTSVAIAPDLGERYLEMIYHDDWVRSNYGDEVAVGREDLAHQF